MPPALVIPYRSRSKTPESVRRTPDSGRRHGSQLPTMSIDQRNPPIIQGGMGVAVSNWRLARAVSLTGNLGVVSGTMLDTVMVRRLQDGDSAGHVRRGLAHFPVPGAAEEILRRYY